MRIKIRVEKRAEGVVYDKKAIIIETEKNYFEFYTNDVNEDVEVEIDNREENIAMSYLCKGFPERKVIVQPD